MAEPALIGGSLFPGEFLVHEAPELPEWKAAREQLAAGLRKELGEIRRRFPAGRSPEHQPSEAVTEDEFIWKVLGALGWSAALRQQNLSRLGRQEVPDGLLFTSDSDTASGPCCPGRARCPSRQRSRPVGRLTEALLERALREGRLLVTKNKDFAVRVRPPRSGER